MKAVWKYQLQPERNQEVEMPKGADILSVDAQHDNLCVWAMVDPKQTEKEVRSFRVIGTGHPIEDAEAKRMRFLGKALMHRGALVWHVFEFR